MVKKITNIKYTSKELEDEYKTKKSYKMIILIIASSETDEYEIFKNCWLGYMNDFPEVKSFFLYSDTNIDCDLLVSENSLTYNCEESYIPGILYKTIAGIDFCYNHLSYEYILRTNLSSFIHIPRVLSYLEKQEKNDYMCTNIEFFPLGLEENEFKDVNPEDIAINKDKWIKYTKILKEFFGYNTFLERNARFYYLAGSFFVLSKNVAIKLLYEISVNVLQRGEIENENISNIPDDVAISAILQLETIKPKYFSNTRYFSYACRKIIDPKELPEHLFHIRNRTDNLHGNRYVDIMNIVEQVRFFMNKPDFMNEI